MTQQRRQMLLAEATELGQNLVRMLEVGDHVRAIQLAQRLRELGVQSLDRLAPRGTLRFAPGSRWGESGLSSRILDHLSPGLSEDVCSALLGALGVWAGGEAVPPIASLLREKVARPMASAETEATILSGLYALHMIGGEQAVLLLREFQNPPVPEKIRHRATWYLNELGARIVDRMFGSEDLPEPTSAEEVIRQDSLGDPYDWQASSQALWEFLVRLSRRFLAREWKGLVADPQQRIDALEPEVPCFMIALPGWELMILEPVRRFFPTRDIQQESRDLCLGDWLHVQLDPESESARYLHRLPLFTLPGGASNEGKETAVVLRAWVSQCAMLARRFTQRGQVPLALAMAALQYHTHEAMGWPCSIPFPSFVESLLRPLRAPAGARLAKDEPKRE